MPKQFTGEVSPPADMKFGADQFVDTSNPLEALPQTMKQLEAASHGLVLQSVSKQFQAEQTGQDELYSQARQAKRGLYDASLAGDEQAISKYSSQLENLKIAERQGAISGQNSQIRQESLLKQTINRYPHLEEEIRQTYSSTRARAQSEREQFKDPIEEGMDDLIKRATSAGRSPAQQLDIEKSQQDFTTFSQNTQMRAMLGNDLQNEFSAAIDKDFGNMAFAEMTNWLNWAQNMSQQNPDFNAEQAKAQFQILKGQVLGQFQQSVNNMLRNSPNPDAVLSRDFIVSKRNEIAKQFDDFASGIDSMDTLKAKQRAMELGKYRGLEKLRQYDPLIAWMVTVNPDKAPDFVFTDWEKTRNVMVNGGISRLNVLIDNATGPEATRMRFQRDMLSGWDGLSQRDYMEKMAGQGGVPESTGEPIVDATRVNAVGSAVLNSNNVTPEMKTNTASALMQAEQVYSKPGEYLAPSEVWYKDATRRATLRTNEGAKKEMTQNVESSTPGIIRNLEGSGSLEALSFTPQLEQDQKAGANPWSVYPSGGPWAASQGQVNSEITALEAKSGMSSNPSNLSGKTINAVKALNNNYWIMRAMYGPAKAEDYSSEVKDLIEKHQADLKAEAEAKAKADESFDKGGQ